LEHGAVTPVRLNRFPSNARPSGKERTVDQVALDLLARSVEHDEWFRLEVEKGRSSAVEGRLLDHDEVASR
jgi:hypothetical protein